MKVVAFNGSARKKGNTAMLLNMVREELGPQGTSDEAKQIRSRLGEIKVKIDTLLDSLTPLNKEFVDEKLTSLKAEKDRLEARLVEIDSPRPRVNVKAIVDAGIAHLRRFGELLAHGVYRGTESRSAGFPGPYRAISEQEARGRALLHSPDELFF